MVYRVQGNIRNTAGAVASIVVVLPNAPQINNLLIAAFLIYSSTPRTVSAIAQTGVTWTKQTGVSNPTTYGRDVEIWAGVVGAGASTTLTATYNNTPSASIVDVCEYSGLLTSGFLDKTATAVGTTSTNTQLTGTTDPTTQTNELWIGAIANIQDKDPDTLSNPTNGFTLLDGASYGLPYCALGYLEKIVSSTGAASSGTTSTPYTTFERYVGCIATFKALATIDRFQEEGNNFRQNNFGATWTA